MGRIIHNLFHVSCLKKVIGKNISCSYNLPPLDDEGQIILIQRKNLENKGEETTKQNTKRIFGTMEGFS